MRQANSDLPKMSEVLNKEGFLVAVTVDIEKAFDFVNRYT